MKTIKRWAIIGKDGELFNGVLEGTEAAARGAAEAFYVHWKDLKQDGAKPKEILITMETED